MKAIIVGGGVGGLTAALMLHARGIDCEVYEQSDAIRELGVGINTLPHAIKELKDLGLLERLDDVAIRTYELFYLNRFGQEIWREPRGTDAGYEVPQFSIHRGRLQAVIYQAVRARRMMAASAPISSTATAPTGRPRAATCWSVPTASIRASARSSIPMRARRAGTASCCGAAPSTGRRT
jgi:2-polyprenyl-6-methoxyphenol hydroxylase-like FAD-dependent oxidoreductase